MSKRIGIPGNVFRKKLDAHKEKWKKAINHSKLWPDPCCKIKKSKIHGQGCFADRGLDPDVIVAIMFRVYKGHETFKMNDNESFLFPDDLDMHPVIGFMNHSDSPNCVVRQWRPGIWACMANEKISKGDELTFDYTTLPDLRGSRWDSVKNKTFNGWDIPENWESKDK